MGHLRHKLQQERNSNLACKAPEKWIWPFERGDKTAGRSGTPPLQARARGRAPSQAARPQKPSPESCRHRQ
eukprot:6174280-Pleurochrysis_carterae.AAC.3